MMVPSTHRYGTTRHQVVPRGRGWLSSARGRHGVLSRSRREISHHPDIHITWQRVEFRVTTHDAGHQLTEADFKLAKEIGAIAERRRAAPEDISR
jgi:Pterin 4 alpha carbinolamine dehydratase